MAIGITPAIAVAGGACRWSLQVGAAGARSVMQHSTATAQAN